jgi:hypothetical protein
MFKFIVSSLALLCSISVCADEVKEKEVVSDESVSSDEAGVASFVSSQNFGCGNCGGKTKK